MAVSPAQIRGNFGQILLAIQTQLVSWLATNLDKSWTVDRVILIARPQQKVPHLMGDQDVLLRVRGESPNANVIDAAGRYDNRRERKVTVTMRCRALLDITGQDGIRLTDQTLGLLTLEDTVLDALETFLVTDDLSNLIAAAPIRMGALSDPEFGGAENRGAWVSSSFDLEIPYERAVTQMPWPPKATGVT